MIVFDTEPLTLRIMSNAVTGVTSKSVQLVGF
jgi:hypothetical protein